MEKNIKPFTIADGDKKYIVNGKIDYGKGEVIEQKPEYDYRQMEKYELDYIISQQAARIKELEEALRHYACEKSCDRVAGDGSIFCYNDMRGMECGRIARKALGKDNV